MQLIVRTTVIRLLALLGTAILGRILLPEDFGTFAVVTFLVNIVQPLAVFGLGPALIQQRERPTELEQSTVFTIQLGTALALTAVIWVLAPLARQVAPSLPADVDWMIRVAALMLPLVALRALPGAMMSRVLRFGPLAAIEVVQTIVYFVASVVLALAGAGAWAFILAAVAHTLAGTILVNLAWRGRLRLAFDRSVARRMIGFGLPFQGTGLLISARDGLIPVFGGLAGGLAAIGFLNFGFRLGRLAGSVDEVIGRVAFPAFSRLQGDQARLQRALTVTLESTALMISGLLAWTIAVAPSLIPLVFSERWRPAIEVFQLISLATFALVPGNFVRGLAFASGHGRSMLYWSAATIGLLAIILPASLILFGVPGGGAAFVVYVFAQLFGYIYSVRDEVAFPWSRMLRIYGVAAVAAASAALVNTTVAAAVANGETGGWAGLVVSGLAFVAVFGGLLLAFERDQVRRAWQLIRGDMSYREIDAPEP
jgi:PST family polysaccharide transporter